MMITNRQLLIGALLLTLFSFLALATLVVRDHRMKARLEKLEERTSQSMNDQIQAAGKQAEANRERLEELADRLSQLEPMNDLVRGMAGSVAAQVETVQELNRLLGEYRALMEDMEGRTTPETEPAFSGSGDHGAENAGEDSMEENGLEKDGEWQSDTETKEFESDPAREWMQTPLIINPVEVP
jgi:uncharacterized coiled-coil protein SlyX